MCRTHIISHKTPPWSAHFRARVHKALLQLHPAKKFNQCLLVACTAAVAAAMHPAGRSGVCATAVRNVTCCDSHVDALNHNVAGGVVQFELFTPSSHQAWQMPLSWSTNVCSNVQFEFEPYTSMQAVYLARY